MHSEIASESRCQTGGLRGLGRREGANQRAHPSAGLWDAWNACIQKDACGRMHVGCMWDACVMHALTDCALQA